LSKFTSLSFCWEIFHFASSICHSQTSAFTCQARGVWTSPAICIYCYAVFLLFRDPLLFDIINEKRGEWPFVLQVALLAGYFNNNGTCSIAGCGLPRSTHPHTLEIEGRLKRQRLWYRRNARGYWSYYPRYTCQVHEL
jgi:hypothetical protein